MVGFLFALRIPNDTLVVWKLDRLGRDLRHLVNLVGDLTKREVGLKVLAGEGANAPALDPICSATCRTKKSGTTSS